jgi:hypothetical protein
MLELRNSAFRIVLLVAGMFALVVAYQSPRALFVDIGGPFDGPHTPGFHEPEQSGQASFRWSAGISSLYFPGVGRPSAPMVVRLQLSSGRGPGSEPLQVAVAANGHALPALSLDASSASYAVAIEPGWIDASGDVRLDFASPTFRSGDDKRDLGFIADFARIELPGGPVVPAIPQLVWLLACAALLYVLLRAVRLAPLPAGLFTFLFLAGCAVVIGVQRLLLTVFTPQLVATLLISVPLALVAEALARWLARTAGWTGERALPEWAWVGLRALTIAAVVLKVGGVLYPHTYIIDAYFHLKQITYMAEGRPWEQFFGKNLALSVMPKEEWGAARAFIPYSPFFYVVAAPLAKLPLPLSVSVPVFSAILEALKLPFVFLLGLGLAGLRPGVGDRGSGIGARDVTSDSAPPTPTSNRRFPTPDPRPPIPREARLALTAAAVYSAIPATFLLQQWGNWPTQASLWLLTLWAAITCLFWARITWLPVWIVSTVALAVTLLSYTVTAAYTGVFIAILVAAGWLFAPAHRKRWSAVALSLVAAVVVSMLVFYGQYIGVLIEETLPTFTSAAQEQGGLTTLRPTLAVFLTGTIGAAMQSYNMAIVYALGLAGALFVFMGLQVDRSKNLQVTNLRAFGPSGVQTLGSPAPMVWLGVWLLTFPLFALLDFYVDQALKEFWFPLPAVAVAGAIWLLAIMRRVSVSRVYSALAWLLFITLAWQSLSLWVFRLLFHNR